VDLVRRELDRDRVPYAEGGLRIMTTVDATLQRAANDALAAGALRVESRSGWPHPTLAKHAAGRNDYLQGMIVALAPATGDVLALTGGRDFAASPFDRAAFALRQPGSAFKPIVYAAAFESGAQPGEIAFDTALSIAVPHGPPYQPANADGEYVGAITLRDALVRSRNTVAVQLGQRVGIDSVAVLAHRLGVGTPVDLVPSTAIGASAVRPIDLVAAYTAFANDGPVARPRLVLRIADTAGRAVYDAPAPSLDSSALEPRVAWMVRDLMRDVVTRGTATSVHDYVPDSIAVAGKTGTTNDNSDVWFVGMTPDIVAGVWLGFDTPASIAPGAVGGTLAAPVWGDMIARYYRTVGRAPGDSAWRARPAGVIPVLLDRSTGWPADSTTPPDRAYAEYVLVPPPLIALSQRLDSVARYDSLRADSTALPSLAPRVDSSARPAPAVRADSLARPDSSAPPPPRSPRRGCSPEESVC
jgi:penicillin-binding protein 2D